MRYADFHILTTGVHEEKADRRKTIRFETRVLSSPAGESTSGEPAEYDPRELRRFVSAAGVASPAPLRRDLSPDESPAPSVRQTFRPELLRFGAELTRLLLPPRARELLSRSLDIARTRGQGLRLRLQLEGPLHQVPWEYALLNGAGGEATASDFLALAHDVSIVRHQPVGVPSPNQRAEMPAKVLVALSSPTGVAPLDLDRERRAVEAALADSSRFDVTWKVDPTPETLIDGVQRAHLFHFAGHGAFEPVPSSDRTTKHFGEGLLVLSDDCGDAYELSASQLALVLAKLGVRVAVLGACESGRRDDVNVWSSVATALLKAGLSAAIGMQYEVLDESAIAFAHELYEGLAAGLSIDESVASGRLRVAQTDPLGWGTPVLYLRDGDGIIFPENAVDAGRERARQELRARASQVAALVHGKLTGIKAAASTIGELSARQQVGEVGPDGEVVGIELK